MTNKLIAAVGAAAVALTVSASASFAGYMQPGETMGLSLDSPLPEGVFFADLEDYGRGTQGPGVANTGVNIPVLLWSTPWTFNDTRLEFLLAVPFAHLDGAVNRVGAITYAFGPILAHDFGNGLTGGVSAFVRTPSPSQNIQVLDGRTATEADFRESLQYNVGGFSLMENGAYTTDFHSSAFNKVNDFFAGDFTIEKTFDKITVGFTGFGFTDVENRVFSGGKRSEIELGGLIAYDFGKFSLTGIVTRSVLERVNGVNLPGAYETRGWVRLVVPLWVAPAPSAPMVRARY